jgi:hypothetical protein
VERPLASAEVLLWGMHNEKGRLTMADQKALTKQALFLVSQFFPTTSYGCLDYRNSLLRKQIYSEQRDLWVWAGAKIV